ncbi:MAG TPA: hypothetical protein VLA34_00445, partial [Candidatus Krumholzibacterium sp.]|nr:hypothetical protein [Candidatus Krumholzibacterium sp.]
MRITHLWKEENRSEEGRTRMSVIVEEPGGEKTTLWYSIPEKYSSYLTSSMDPFVLGTLFRAMSGADRMDVHGTVSPSLLTNLEEFQSVWAEWLPDELRRIDIRAEEEQETTSAEEPGGALCAFSGGLDAAFTLYKHRMTDTGRRKRDINACLFVQGFDIPVDADEVFERVTARNRKMTDSIGIELITMKTNYKAVDVNWRHSHGLGVGSSLMVLNGGFSEGLIG